MDNTTPTPKSSFPEGQDLLRGLYSVRDYLQRIIPRVEEFWACENRYTSAQRGMSAGDTLNNTADEMTGPCLLGTTFCLVFGIISVLGGNIPNLIFCLIAAAIFARAEKGKNRRYLRFGVAVVALLLILWVAEIIVARWLLHDGFPSAAIGGAMGSPLYWYKWFIGFNVAAIIIGALAAPMRYQRYRLLLQNRRTQTVSTLQRNNRQARESVSNLTRRMDGLSAEINSLVTRMREETASWYPADYYSLEAVIAFISIIGNHEAETVKEMVSIYMNDSHHPDEIAQPEEIKKTIQQTLSKQGSLMFVLRHTNMIQMDDLVLDTVAIVNSTAVRADLDSMNDDIHTVNQSFS